MDALRAWQRHRIRWIGGHLALDFINTRRWHANDEPGFDCLTKYFGLIRWCEEAGVLEEKSGNRLRGLGLRRAKRARDAVRWARAVRAPLRTALLARARGRPVPADTVQQLDAAVERALKRRRLAVSGDGWIWDRSSVDAAVPVYPVVLAGVDLLMSEDVGRVRRCAGPGCGLLFLNPLAGPERRWCEMAVCGNRAKATRFRRRRARRIAGPAMHAPHPLPSA